MINHELPEWFVKNVKKRPGWRLRAKSWFWWIVIRSGRRRCESQRCRWQRKLEKTLSASIGRGTYSMFLLLRCFLRRRVLHMTFIFLFWFRQQRILMNLCSLRLLIRVIDSFVTCDCLLLDWRVEKADLWVSAVKVERHLQLFQSGKLAGRS